MSHGQEPGRIGRVRGRLQSRLDTWELDRQRPDWDPGDLERVEGAVLTLAGWLLGVRPRTIAGRHTQHSVGPAPATGVAVASRGAAESPAAEPGALARCVLGLVLTIAGLVVSLAVILAFVALGDLVGDFVVATMGAAPLWEAIAVVGLTLTATPLVYAGFRVGSLGLPATLGAMAAWTAVFLAAILLDVNGIPPLDDDPEGYLLLFLMSGAVGSALCLGLGVVFGFRSRR